MESDIFILLVGCVIVALSIFIVNRINSRRAVPENDDQEVRRQRGIPRDADAAPRRAGRNVRARMRAAANRQEEDDDDDIEDPLAEDMALPEGKIGAKKRKKLEMKAEKRQMRERELEEREERRQRQQELDERRKKEDEKEKAEERKKEEEEKALKEEQERKELEEYLKLKEAFQVEEEGFEEEENIEESHKFQEFINYINEQKVVVFEDLASQFKLKTQDAIDRVQQLIAQETLVGVLDDRGKFISITRDELESVAQFIQHRGRVSISELAESSNTLINLQPQPVITA